MRLAIILFTREKYDSAKAYAEKVTNADLFMESYLIEESRVSIDEDKINEISGYYYSLKSKAKTIIGLCNLKKEDYENAIESFEEIKPKEDSYYYIGIAYGLKGDVAGKRKYFEKNMNKGTFGLIQTDEWLRKNPKSK